MNQRKGCKKSTYKKVIRRMLKSMNSTTNLKRLYQITMYLYIYEEEICKRLKNQNKGIS